MLRKLIVAALASVLIAGGALAQAKFGTADEAKAMLEKAVAAIKADKAKALHMFLKGEGGIQGPRSLPVLLQHLGRQGSSDPSAEVHWHGRQDDHGRERQGIWRRNV